MTDGLSIVPMAGHHLNTLAELEKICFSVPWSRAALAAELGKETSFFAVAEFCGTIAGYAGMSCVMDECYINNIAVFPQFRRMGIGRALVLHLIGEAEHRSASFITLEVRASNSIAIALYKSLGFQEEGRRRGYYSLPQEDALIFTLRFSKGCTPVP
ncbi:MAG TPA: ribosomal-protein-alanine N-acetyltransferase [Ruminococcaceae bacterium]|nr:ribosomal-protein-alanine N-acetyltransferase [Oscillospiraceae bacterium]